MIKIHNYFSTFVLLFVSIGFCNINIDSLINKGLNQMNLQNYDISEKIFSKIPKDNPERFFFKAMLYQTKMLCFDDYRFGDSLINNSLLAIKTSEELIKKGDFARGYFYNGYAYGTISAYEEKIGSKISCFFHGYKGVSLLRKSLEYKKDFFDAYAGIGVYHYWKSKAVNKINWIPFLTDERKIGKEELLIALRKGNYFRNAARYSLIWVYFVEGDYKTALAIIDEFLTFYPQNTIFLRAKCDVLFKMGSFSQAVLYYKKLLNSFKKNPTQSGFLEMQCMYKLAYSLSNTGNYNESLVYYNRVLKSVLPKWTKSKAIPIKRKAKTDMEKILKHETHH